MANGYIGKISAVVTASTADLERKLRGAKGEVERFGRSLNSTIASASRSAENSLNGIFTPLQKLQRALQAASGGRLNLIDQRDVGRIQQLSQAAREVAAPLKGIATGFDRISDAIAGEFTPALNLAQQQTKLLERGIQTFGGVSERAFERVRQRAEDTAQAFSRIREAASAASGLATGQELRFTNPALVAENARAAALQSRAASLSPDQITGGSIAGLVAQQRQASEEAARLQANLENIRVTRQGDSAEAERALAVQVAAYGRVNAQLDEQIARFARIDEARRRAASAPDTFGATEFARRDGAPQRRNAANFEDATAGIFTQQTSQQGVFAQAQRTVESELARTAALREQFLSLPPAVQQSLEQERAALNNIGTAARAGAAGVGALADANDRMAAKINEANAALTEQERLNKANSRLAVIPIEDINSERAGRIGQIGDDAVSGVPRTFQQIEQEFQGLAARISRLNIGERSGLQKLIQDFRDSVAAGRPLIEQYQLLLRLGKAVSSIDGKGLRATGDIARGAFGNASLAIQQATFAIDDFFSVTGGLDQRIRAAGNNLSQLGFILGGVEGLILGVATSITAQLLVAYSRWANNTDVVEAATKSLNESLSQQESTVKSLADAYRRLATELSGSGIASEGPGRVEQDIRERAREIDLLNRDRRSQEAAALDPNVANIRGQRVILEDRLDKETDQEERLRLQARIARLRREESAAADGFFANGITRGEVGGSLVSARQAAARSTEQLIARAEFAAQNGLNPEVVPGLSTDDLRRQLEQQRAQLRDAQDNGANADRSAQAQQLREARDSLVEQRDRIAEARASGQSSLAIEPIEQEIDRISVALRRVEASLLPQVQEINTRFTEQALRIASSLGGIASTAQELNAFSIADEAQAIGARLGELQEQLASATTEEEARAAADQIGALEEQRAAILSAVTSLDTFASVLDRVSNDLANTVAQEARSAADQARRDENAAEARAFGVGGARRSDDQDFAFSRRVRLDIDARLAERRAREVEQENARARQQFEKDALDGSLGAEAQALVRQRDEAQAVLDDQKSTADQRAAATRARDDANAQLVTKFEVSPEGRAARDRADSADVEAQQAALRDADILRGRELAETPAARAGRELADNLLGLERFFENEVDDARLNQADADAQLAEARRRQISEAFRSQAPAIAGLADSVANAVLQGPSRAALNATDVSTVEGASELNRLIRGDDAARDQNLEELRRQSGQLDQLIQAVRDNGGDVAN